VAGIFVWLTVRDAPPGHPYFSRKPEDLRAVWLGLGEVIRNRRLPYIIAINSVTYGSTLTIVALWGGPYLTNVHGLDGVGRGNILLLATIGQVVGHLAYGRMDRWLDTRKWLIVGGASCFIVIFATLALVPHLALWQVALLFTLMGTVSSYSSMITTHGRTIFPDRLVGRGMTTNNMSVFLGAAILQWLSGLVIGAALDAGLSEGQAFRVMFAFLAVLLAIGLSIYSRIDDAKPSADARRHAAELAARAAQSAKS
jgi:predicted MFS family arabinose efflux permease